MKWKSILGLACVALFAMALASGGPITQCPAVGLDTMGCELLVTINAVDVAGAATAFTVTTASPDQGPYDGVEDTLVGIQNSSGGIFTSISFTNVSFAGIGAFAFDGDGACAAIACMGGDSTGYGGPGVTFSAISGSILENGTVNFAAGLADTGSAWFSLEEKISGSVLQGVPEPASLALMCAGLVGFLLVGRWRFASR